MALDDPIVQSQQPVDLIRYPPFPTPPDGVTLVSFKDFKQAGIEIFSEDGIERDGRGIPTIPLRVRHETDSCKTEAARQDSDSNQTTGKKKKKGKKVEKPADDREPILAGDDNTPKIDHVQQARDKKHARMAQFSVRKWYEVWADGEDLRGLKISYESSLSPVDRIHTAATDFRTGRPWPHAKTQVAYMWDQMRIFSGLLGQLPVWIRTDLQHDSDNDISDDEEEFESQVGQKPRPAQPPPRPKTSSGDSDSELAPPEEEEETKIRPRPQNVMKRVLPRAPYALYNVDPIRVSSADEVPPLLARASRIKAAQLSAFLFHPGPIARTRIFLSSHMRREGLVYTPSFLRDAPRLMLFWIEYLLRTGALKEVERELRGARDIARRAVEELIRTGVVCKRLPDRVGKGMKGFFGARWQDEEDLEKKEKIKLFEDALKAENVLFVDSKDLPPSLDVPDEDLVTEASRAATLDIAEPSLANPKTSAFIEEVHVGDQGLQTEAAPKVDTPNEMSAAPRTSDDGSKVETTESTTDSAYPSFSIPIEELDTPDMTKWGESTDPEAHLAAWLDPPVQPLFELMGPTVFPLKFEAGGMGVDSGPWTWLAQTIDSVQTFSPPIPIQTEKRAFVERSMRRVKSIHPPRDLAPAEKAVAGYVSKGVESQIVERLARIVLEPWLDWDPEGKVEPTWSKPRVQRPNANQDGKQPQDGEARNEDGDQKKEPPVQHDAEKDEILLLVEPDVLQTVFVGMGIAGTWVQLVRVPSSPLAPSSGPPRGRGGGRGRGQGRGRGRGGGPPAGSGEMQERKQLTWWYVEDIYMAIPSYWLIGEDVVIPEELDGDV